MPDRDSLAETLILDALRAEAKQHVVAGVLLIGMHACTSVKIANEIVGSERVTLLHLDRATGAVACGGGNQEHFVGDRGWDFSGSAPARFSVVGLNVEAAKSYRLLREIVGQLPGYLDEHGTVLAAGPKKGGAEVAARILRERFASVELSAYRKGQRIYRATTPLAELAPGQTVRAAGTAGEVVTLVLRGLPLRLIQDERIFARGRLDPATRMLAEVFEIPTGAAVLDLGSGSGILGILAALLEPDSQVALVDSDPLAVQVSRRNAVLNGAANVSVTLSDVLDAIPGQTFDVVLGNPPFHRGRSQDVSIAERFMTEASRALRPGGSLYVVCNRFLRYEPILVRLLGTVQEVAGDAHFKVLLARRAEGRWPTIATAGRVP